MYVLVLHFLNSFANLLFPYVRQQHKSWHANFLRNFGIIFTFASFFPLETGALADASFLALHPDPPNNSPRPLGPVQ